MGFFEIRSSQYLERLNPPVSLMLSADKAGMAQVELMDVHKFDMENMFPYNNLMRKWSKLCISFNFQKNEAQAAINGRVSKLVSKPGTMPNYGGKFDGGLLENVTDLVFIIGRYSFDKNPFIGNIADINIWSTTMNTEELSSRTDCKTVSKDRGDLVSWETRWTLTSALVSTIVVPEEDLACTQYKGETHSKAILRGSRRLDL